MRSDSDPGARLFGPVRGSWPDDAWKGWWGDDPAYHSDVFVLTHHARAPIAMQSGTTFHFVTDGIHAALERARPAVATWGAANTCSAASICRRSATLARATSTPPRPVVLTRK